MCCSGHLLKSVNSVSGTLGNPSLVPPTPVLIEEIEAVQGQITKIQVVNDKKGIDIIICTKHL